MNYTIDLGRNILESLSRVYRNEERIKLDDRDDSEFYSQPRMDHNVDPSFRERLTDLYYQHLHHLSPGSTILDLCSSAHSHLPPGLLSPITRLSHSTSPNGRLPRLRVLGHGMNSEELAANPALDTWFIQDLNRRTQLDLPSASLQAVLCCCGVQYLQWPEEVAAEVLRLLSPGGVFIVSFSSPVWAEKATAGWLTRTMEERMELVASILENAGFEGIITVLEGHAETGNGAAAETDPFFWVVGYRPAEKLQPGRNPEELAREYVPPALAELDLTKDGYVSDSTLQRWKAAYGALTADARELGIPQSAIPQLPEDADAAAVKEHRDHLQDMIASFLSAGL